MDSFRNSTRPVERCLRDSGVDWRNVLDVVLISVHRSIIPDVTVDFGAVAQAAILTSRLIDKVFDMPVVFDDTGPFDSAEDCRGSTCAVH